MERCTVAAPDELLTDVLDRTTTRATGGGLPVLVMDDGRLAGIVTARDMSRILQQHTLSSRRRGSGGTGGGPGTGPAQWGGRDGSGGAWQER
jgi:hypothetical protein